MRRGTPGYREKVKLGKNSLEDIQAPKLLLKLFLPM